MATVYFARNILMPDGHTVLNGGITVEGSAITSVGARGQLKRSSKDRIVNLGDMLLLPGLINVHTHLEESAIRDLEKKPDETFGSWIIKKQSRLRSVAPAEFASAIRLAAREALANGITGLADTTRCDQSPTALAGEPIRSWIFYEVHPETDQADNSTVEDVSARIDAAPANRPIGVAPHALYSLSPAAHQNLYRHGQSLGWLWSMHLAESAEELQAFEGQSGDLFFQITRRKSWPFANTRRGPGYTAITENLIPHNGICIHCTYLDGQELSLLAAKNASVVLCPQYAHALGHKPFPIDVALRRGINLCIATEAPGLSRALNLFDELFLIRQSYPHISASDLLRTVTINPARALGVSERLGSLDIGKEADVIGLRLHQENSPDPLDDLLGQEIDVGFVMVAGEEIIIH